LLYRISFVCSIICSMIQACIMQTFNVESIGRFTYSIGRFCFKLDIPYVSYSAKKCMFHPMYCLDVQTHSTTKDSILEEYPFQSVDKEGQWI